MEVVPDSSGIGYSVKVSGNCDDELDEIKNEMGPQGFLYLKKRLKRDE